MLNIQMYQRVKLLYGNGSVRQTGELMQSMGAKKPFIVCDKGVAAAGILQKITESLEKAGISYVLFDGVVPDPPADMAEQAAALCKAEGCDSTIAVGGGSCMDTGKAVNMMRFNEGPILRFTDFSTPMNPSPGLVCVPTTSGTGSEVSDGLVISVPNGAKCPMLATNAMADYAIIDPELMVGMPPRLTAMTGLDTLTHVVESYTTNVTNDLIGFFTEKAIDEVVRWLPVAVKDGQNLEARGRMAVCCCVGGWMLGYGHTNAGHSISHVLGSLFHVPHGAGCGFAMPYVLEFNAPAIPGRVRVVAEKLGASFTGSETPEEIGAKARDAALRFVYGEVGLERPKAFPYDESLFDEAAQAISEEMFQAFQPRKMEKADALEILKKIYA